VLPVRRASSWAGVCGKTKTRARWQYQPVDFEGQQQLYQRLPEIKRLSNQQQYTTINVDKLALLTADASNLASLKESPLLLQPRTAENFGNGVGVAPG